MFDYLNTSDRDMLLNHIKTGKIAHAYLFYGAGEEKMDFTVDEFIKTVYCKDAEYYCDRCLECEKINRNENPDVTHVYRDGKNIRIKQIRTLQYEATLSASEYAYSIFVIHLADQMTQEAANAFLKTLEEPAENTVMILTASSRQALLPTIISRCIPVKVTESGEENALTDSEKLYVLEAVREIASGNSMNLVNVSMKLSKERDKAVRFIAFMLRFFTDVLVYKESEAENKEENDEYMDFVIDFNGKVSFENLDVLIARTMEIYEAVQYNVNLKSAFMNLFINVEETAC